MLEILKINSINKSNLKILKLDKNNYQKSAKNAKNAKNRDIYYISYKNGTNKDMTLQIKSLDPPINCLNDGVKIEF